MSPHLSDLQPSDESVAFNYFSLALAVRGEAEPEGPPVNSIGFIELFGSPDHAESMMVLRPGEWIRVSANIKLLSSPSKPVSVRFQGGFWVRRNTFHPHAGGQFIEANNLYPNSTPDSFRRCSFTSSRRRRPAKAVDFSQTLDERRNRKSLTMSARVKIFF